MRFHIFSRGYQRSLSVAHRDIDQIGSVKFTGSYLTDTPPLAANTVAILGRTGLVRHGILARLSRVDGGLAAGPVGRDLTRSGIVVGPTDMLATNNIRRMR